MVLHLNKKGQSSIEFVLLLVVLLVFIQVVIVPAVNTSQDAATDVARLGQAKLAAQQLADAINLVGSSSEGARQTVHIILPNDSSIVCNSSPASVTFSSRLDSNAGFEGKSQCVASTHVCQSTISVNTTSLSCIPSLMEGKRSFALRVEKATGGVVNVSEAPTP
ncbi:MAG: hypothetical protein V1847_04975 [Candidatus Diapherotrites archaeon]